jgi:outer membrane PBP1 activator LpoA protein
MTSRDPSDVLTMTPAQVADVADANYQRALANERLAESNVANCVPWRWLRWWRTNREVRQANREIRAISAAIRTACARRRAL